MTNNQATSVFSTTAYDTGLSFFMKWRQFDEMLKHWAEQYFGRAMDVEGEREEESVYIALKGLKLGDFVLFKQLFDQYDLDGDYDAEDEFPTPGSKYSALPEEISRSIIFDMLEPHLKFRPAYTIATCKGVWFFRREPDEKEFDIRSFDIEQPAAISLKPAVVVIVEDGGVTDVRTNIPVEWGVDFTISDRDVLHGCSEEEAEELEESFKETDEEAQADGWYSAVWA